MTLIADRNQTICKDINIDFFEDARKQSEKFSHIF